MVEGVSAFFIPAIGELIEVGVPVFDPWASVFHIDGKKAAIKAPATLEAVAGASAGP